MAWNAVQGVVAIGAGIATGSVSLNVFLLYQTFFA